MAATSRKKLGFIIGHNLPGCLPDGEPDFYPDAESVQFGFVDMVNDALEYSELDYLEAITIRSRVSQVTEEDLDGMMLSQEMNVMIDGRIYWVTKCLDIENVEAVLIGA